MFEKIIVAFIVACCSYFIGRRFYRQWKNALQNREISCCSDSCRSCAPSSNRENKKS